GGVVFLSVSSQYGPARVDRLCQEEPGFAYEGVLASSGWAPFDLGRPDLLQCLRQYAAEERRGGLAYAFRHPDHPEKEGLDARTALAYHETTGCSPLSQWQTLLF